MNDFSISVYISSIERDYNYFMNRELREYKLGKHDIRVLKEINAHDGISQNEICSILKEDKITVSKSVKNLVEQEYVEKARDPDDRRIIRLSMTEKGLGNRNEILEVFTRANEIFVKNFSRADREKARELLKQISENIHNESIRLSNGK